VRYSSGVLLLGLTAHVYEEAAAASPYDSVTDYASPSNTEHETDTEVGYFNGQVVTLGLVVEDHLSVSPVLVDRKPETL
jgi:hypothetical protein